MSKNQVFGDIPSTRRVRTVGSNVAPGTPVIADGRGAVCITGSGDYTRNVVLGPYTVAVTGGGVGLADEDATLAFTGSWAYDVVGATAATAPGTPVFLDGDDVTLTAADPDDPQFGVVDFFRGEKSATDTVVKIGAV